MANEPEQQSEPVADATLTSLRAGQIVDHRYRLEALIGKGGMGVVWRAHDRMLDLPVALKFLNDLLRRDPAALEDLKHETRRSLQLTHPHIVRVHGLVDDGDFACIAMEVVPGENLTQRRLRQPHHWFEPAQIARWIAQLCDALSHAHERAHVIHRDLKPSNLLLDEHDDLKVTDFGIAAVASDSLTRLTGSSASGTMAYMSPQQADGHRPRPADDLYSLGATIFDLLTGRPPFFSGNVYAQLMGRVPPTIHERRLETEPQATPVPPEWEAVVAALLAKSPEDRPADAREVARRLGLPFVTLDGVGIAASAPEVSASTPVIRVSPAAHAAVNQPASEIENAPPTVLAAPARGKWSRMAITAFVLGCLPVPFLLAGTILSPFAFLCGHLAQRQIARSAQPLRGARLALIAKISGAIGSVVLVTALLLMYFKKW